MGLLHKSQHPVCITPRCKKYFFLRTLPCMINKIIQLNKNDFDSLIILCFGPFITSKTSLLIFFSVAHKHTQSHTHTHTFDRPENIDFSHTHALTWTRTFFYQKLRGCLLCCSVIDRMPRISVTEWEEGHILCIAMCPGRVGMPGGVGTLVPVAPIGVG